MYKPTLSSSFSTNFGAREILNPRTRCGLMPAACQQGPQSCESCARSGFLLYGVDRLDLLQPRNEYLAYRLSDEHSAL